jgi:dipeptidase E
MKLLLTSAGITNNSIAKALFDLVGKKPEETKIVVIPTASNVEAGGKSWFIHDLLRLENLGFEEIEIADISAVGENIWKPKLERADILFFEGGNTYHLMEWLVKSGLSNLLPELLKTKVYVGVSAGSMVLSKDLALNISKMVYGEDLEKTQEMSGLNYVSFYFLPHLNSEYFQNVRRETIESATAEMSEAIYALDDNSALKVVDDKVEIITEGEYFTINI